MSTVQPLPLDGPPAPRGRALRAVPTPPGRPSSEHDRALAACGPGPFSGALLLGTGNGALPALLADRCLALRAVDPSSTAAALAQERLADRPWASAEHGALPEALPTSGTFDLLVVSDVLCRLPDEALRRTVDRLPLLLRPDARVVAVHWCGRAPGLGRSAADAHRALRLGAGLRPVGTAGVPGARGHLLDAFVAR